MSFNAPEPSSIPNRKPSQAEDNNVISPVKLSALILAIAAAAPLAPSLVFTNFLFNFAICGAFAANV